MKKKIVSIVVLIITVAAACVLAGCTKESKLTVTDKGNGAFDCVYEEVKHDFVVCLPENSKNAPLVIILPGAGDSAENCMNTIEFHKDANPLGYGVCYVTGSINGKAGRNSKSWNYGRTVNDYDDVGFLKELIAFLADKYSFDEDRVFCAGFSNGGFMNHRLALEAQDTFKACVSVAGALCKNLWDKRAEKNDFGFMQIVGEIDEAVPKNLDGSATYALDPAIEDVIDYYVSSNGLEKKSEETIGNGSTFIKYGKDGDEDIIWTILVKDGRHAWPNEELNGFSTNKLVLNFFESWK